MDHLPASHIPLGWLSSRIEEERGLSDPPPNRSEETIRVRNDQVIGSDDPGIAEQWRREPQEIH